MDALALRRSEVSPLEEGAAMPRQASISPPAVPLQPAARAYPNTRLHGQVVKMLAGINAFIIGAFWVIFQGDAEALFMVAIGGVYLIAYLGTPWAMARVGGLKLDEQKSFGEFLREPFETWTGVITGRQAAIQVLLVPSAIALAVVGMGMIIDFNR